MKNILLLLLFCTCFELNASSQQQDWQELVERVNGLENDLAQEKNENKLLREIVSNLENATEILSGMNNINVMRTCYEYWQAGLTKNGIYKIDPDGLNNGNLPFSVYCDFTTGITEVRHDSFSPTNIPKCNTIDCFQHRINYPTNLKQLTNLIDLSASCTQSIKYDCFLAPLYDDLKTFGTWINRDFSKEVYFVGSNSGQHVCSCHFSNSCASPDHTCNCDSNDPQRFNDQGVITDMSDLPIMGFNYYGLKYDSEKAAISYGPLKCQGAKPFTPGKSCYDLKLQGETISGYFEVSTNLPKGSGPQFQTVFCDFSKNLDDTGLQTDILPPIRFEVARDAQKWTIWSATRVITYNNILSKTGNFINIDTGVFTAPKDGTYRFFFKTTLGEAPSVTNRAILRINGNQYDMNYSQNTEDWTNDPFFMECTPILKKGDEVDVMLIEGSICMNQNHLTRFGGELIY